TWRQFSVDSSQPNKDRIVLMGSDKDYFSWPDESRQLGELYPEIEKSCCVISQGGTLRAGEMSVTEDYEDIILIVDSTFFDMFKYKFLEGIPEDALSSPEKCVITKSLALSLYPNGSPLGETLQIIGQRAITMGGPDPYDSTLVYTVSGVIDDLDKTIFPNETKIIANMARSPEILGYRLTGKGIASSGHGYFKTFFQLREGASLDSKTDEISDYLMAHIPAMKYQETSTVVFTPLRELFFAPQNGGLGMEKGEKGLLFILVSVILAILFFAVTNYINLTVANTGMRAREMATRRLLGSGQNEIVSKLIAESILVVLVSFLIGLGLAFAFQNDFASMFKGRIILENDFTPGTVSVCIAFILIVGVLAGLIPSLQIASFAPVDVVKGSFRFRSKLVFGRISIMLQNIISVVLLTFSLVITLQIRGLVYAPLGFNTKDIVQVYADSDNVTKIYDILKKMPCVRKIGFTSGTSMVTGYSSVAYFIDLNNEGHPLFLASMDTVAFGIYGFDVLRGNPPVPGKTYFNETFMRTLGLDDDAEVAPLSSGENLTVDGVVKDFRRGNILADVIPFRISLQEPDQKPMNALLVKTDGTPDAWEQIRSTVTDAAQELDEKYYIIQNLQEEVALQFEDQRDVLKIVLMFTGIAMLISIFGFIGMSLFFIRQR
ncbi:MAG: FtsX-like permease family protein, partial [Candidatus Cryptobacteroides sp.]